MAVERAPKRKQGIPDVDEGLEFIRDKRGRKKAVILPIRRYRELLERLEDMHDLYIIEKRRHEPRIPWEDVKKRLREDGVLPD
jgi:hypothetical protein